MLGNGRNDGDMNSGVPRIPQRVKPAAPGSDYARRSQENHAAQPQRNHHSDKKPE